MNDELIKQYALFIYTTPSHSEEIHRFRIVFQTPYTVKNKKEWKKALQGIGRKFGGDPAVKDGARLFYGNSNAVFYRFNKRLSQNVFEEIKGLAFSKIRNTSTTAVSYRTSITLEPSQKVVTASGYEASIEQLLNSTSIFCPIHIDQNPSAFVVTSRQGVKGVHCSTCDATFWTQPLRSYKFDAFEKLISERLIKCDDSDSEESSFLFIDKEKTDPSVRLKERYLPSLTYKPGITLVRSPKGSGKTAALKRLVDSVKAYSLTNLKTDFPRSILLIGHRQTLLREACHKLDLQCYLDSEPTSFYGISVDSIGIKLNRKTGFQPYDLVLIDESEQVFSHLTSETLSSKKDALNNAFIHLKFYIRSAKAIVALDADLDVITITALKVLKPQMWEENLRLIYNETPVDQNKVPIHLYRSRGHLVEEVISALKRGEKCLITSNSKNQINDIDATIRKNVKCEIIKITSENSRDDDAVEFVKNICERAKNYDAILASPSLGTGVDITFPNNEIIYENVFGFFQSFINTHTDIDQQLARVRHTKNVRIYINPRSFSVETDPNVILENLGRGGISSKNLEISDNGDFIFERNDPLLQIYSEVIAFQNASKSQILQNFSDLKAKQGIEVIKVDRSKKISNSGNTKLRLGRQNRIDAELSRFENAPILSQHEFLYLYARRLSNGRFSKLDELRFERALVERLFQKTPDRNVLKEIINGGFIEKMNKLHSILGNRHLGTVISLAHSFIEDGNEQKYLTKMPITMLVEVVLVLCGFFKDERLIMRHTVSQSELEPFIKFCKSNYVMIGEIIGKPIRKDFETRALLLLNTILSEVGLVLEKRKVTKKGGKASTIYGFDPKRLRQLDGYMKSYTPLSDRVIFEEVDCVKANGELDYQKFKDHFSVPPASFSKKIHRVEPI